MNIMQFTELNFSALQRITAQCDSMQSTEQMGRLLCTYRRSLRKAASLVVVLLQHGPIFLRLSQCDLMWATNYQLCRESRIYESSLLPSLCSLSLGFSLSNNQFIRIFFSSNLIPGDFLGILEITSQTTFSVWRYGIATSMVE